MTSDPPANDPQDSRQPRSTPRGQPRSRQTPTRSDSGPRPTGGKAAHAQVSRGGAPATRSTKPKVEVAPVPILILGAQGCGKSSFINAAFGKDVRETSNEFDLTTKEFDVTSGLSCGEHNFVLVDSPGFDNAFMNDAEIMTKLIRFLCSGKAGASADLAGVIYLHNQEARLGSGILKRNLYLIESILGNSFMDRLTILLVPRPGERASREKLIQPLLDPKSPFYPLYDSGARVDVAPLKDQPVRKLLLSYARKAPISMSVQNELCKNGRVPNDGDINTYLIKCTRARESAPVVTRPKIPAATISRIHPESARNGPNEVKRPQPELAVPKNQMEEFSSQLQQQLDDYTALRSQLQINENIEQRDIVQNLIDLNRRIDDLALSLSQHLVDTYGGDNITTTEHAFQLPELKRLFEHEEGKASLVLSSKGEGMPLEDFLDVSIRSIICEQVYKRILAPFHPGLAFSDARNKYVSVIYSRIREKEDSQAILGRWRTASFTAISELIGEPELSSLKSKAGLDILDENLMPMLQYLFGPHKNARPRDAHVKELSEIATQAWDWTGMLREKVVLLGDFQPTAYRYGREFDPALMSEFEPRRGAPPPARILSTIGLGLNVLRAQASGEGPDRAILRQASVVTEGWFERP